MQPLRLSNRLSRSFDDYAMQHQSFANQLTHAVGVPMIVFSLLGILSHLEVAHFVTPFSVEVSINLGLILWFLAGIFYFFLDWRLALPFQFCSLGLYLASQSVTLFLLWTLFLVGWVLQFVGHVIWERRQPAFFNHLKYVLIGPFWMFAQSINYVNPDLISETVD